MADDHITCPHCKGQIKYFGVNTPHSRNRKPTFEQTANSDFHVTRTPPKNLLGSLIYFLRGHTWTPEPEPQPGDITIRVEHITEDKRHWLLDRLDQRITIAELWRVADVIIKDQKNFSRPVLTRYANLSQNKFHLIDYDFKRLNYCFKANGNRTLMTPKGTAFLETILEHFPSPP